MSKTLTIQIKVINRIKIPLLPKEYVKQPKLPVRTRTCDSDHLNVYAKEIPIGEDWRARDAFANELQKLSKVLPLKMSISPDFNDTLVGYISDYEFGDFYIQLFTSKKWKTI